MELSNDWQMGKDYFEIIGIQIQRVLLAQTAAKEDPQFYDEWYDELLKLDCLAGSLFTQKDIDKVLEQQQIIKETLNKKDELKKTGKSLRDYTERMERQKRLGENKDELNNKLKKIMLFIFFS